MCFDHLTTDDMIVNFKPVHFGNRPGVSRNMTDLSPEHVNIIARTAWLQRFGRVGGLIRVVAQHIGIDRRVMDRYGRPAEAAPMSKALAMTWSWP